MTNASASSRVFLLLQGPHGPFFAGLAKALRASGATVWRVGFNAGDRAFWPDAASYIACDSRPDMWHRTLGRLIDRLGVTDLVLYGDTRPVHQVAATIARTSGLPLHVFEEGYLRPHWITYERGGVNGNSRLMSMPMAQIAQDMAQCDADPAMPPARWGDMRQHVFYGALYHWHVLFRNRRYPHHRSHRQISVGAEFRLYLRRLAQMPLDRLRRGLGTRRLLRLAAPYHLALLQLDHDSALRAHSAFRNVPEFLDRVLTDFAAGAPPHHHLVIKAHPLESGRMPLRRITAQIAAARGIGTRVHFLPGGKLAPLLADARSAVTINSTAGQQALWRGIPVRIFGDAIYGKPAFVSDQPLPAFFAHPRRPDGPAYRLFRRFLLETCQVPGSYYSAAGRRRALRQIADLMLAPGDPYDTLRSGCAAPRQQLRLTG